MSRPRIQSDEQIRATYGHVGEDVSDAGVAEYQAEFDRWLVDHDAKVYQRAREDARRAVEASVACYSITDGHDEHGGWDLLCREHAALAAADLTVRRTEG